MILIYTSKSGLKVQITNIGAQNIDGSLLKTFEIIIADFQVKDKLGRAQFFQESSLLADTRIEVVLGIPFFTISNADI